MEKYKIRTTRELLVEYNNLNVEKNSECKEKSLKIEEEMRKIESEVKIRYEEVFMIIKSIDKQLASFEIERLLKILMKNF